MEHTLEGLTIGICAIVFVACMSYLFSVYSQLNQNLIYTSINIRDEVVEVDN